MSWSLFFNNSLNPSADPVSIISVSRALLRKVNHHPKFIGSCPPFSLHRTPKPQRLTPVGQNQDSFSIHSHF
jgi:hypothetical protein